ncbi:MAG: ribonuclease HI [Clostridia bacterium]|nr:ribonuclease HI [Clostridia bacterium]
MMKVIIYTDGACSGNPGPGGYGAILMCNDKKKEISGGEKNTTNNKMELLAAVEALKLLKMPCEVDLYSDSAYLINCFNNNWLESWKKNGWKNSKKESVKNIDLWQELDKLNQIHKITWIKVKGHADNEYNNRCDYLARSEINKL